VRSGRRGPKRRPKRTVLIVTNGKETELSYLKKLPALAKVENTSITCKFVNGEPESILRNLSSPHGNTSDYDEVWIVIDEDGHDRAEFVQSCQARCGKNQSWFAIVTRPCFEVWLVAHYQQIGNYFTQAQAQKAYLALLPEGSDPKILPRGFPISQVLLACKRCQLKGKSLGALHSLPPLPGSAMPHLISALNVSP
jgi:hypothetical protein